jgi:hypothetical protein
LSMAGSIARVMEVYAATPSGGHGSDGATV